MRLFLASTNPGKLREFRSAALASGIAVEALPDINQLPDCIEDRQTFEENARKKAVHYSHYTDGLVFADDSGIAVDALDGAPGVRSARFAGPLASDAANNAKLIEELRRVAANRSLASTAPGSTSPPAAHYICVIALARRGQVLAVTEGRADGVILAEPRGSGGFGYDPYFFYPPLGKTFAELSPGEKFAVSHRGEAFRKLLAFLRQAGPGETADEPSATRGTEGTSGVLS
jgi:XTP/dITP diphosphohydrolase